MVSADAASGISSRPPPLLLLLLFTLGMLAVAAAAPAFAASTGTSLNTCSSEVAAAVQSVFEAQRFAQHPAMERRGKLSGRHRLLQSTPLLCPAMMLH
jgi:hypothetical protein